MKLIIAYLPQHKLDHVLGQLPARHAQGVSMTSVHSFDHPSGDRHSGYRSFTSTEMTKRVRIELPCEDDEAEAILAAIYKGAHTGLRGNGKVFVLPLLDAMRLRTGERGEAAIRRPEPPP